MVIYSYSTSWCKDCQKEHDLLNRNNIPYIIVDIDTAPDPLLKRHNIDIIPTTEVEDNGEVIFRKDGNLTIEEINKIKEMYHK